MGKNTIGSLHDVQLIYKHIIYLSMVDVHRFQVINTRLPHPLPARSFLLRTQKPMNNRCDGLN